MSDQPIDRRNVLKAAAVTGVAAAGFTGNATAHELPHTITIKARGEFVKYSFEVSERVEPGPKAENSDEVRDNNRAEGAVAGNGMDDFRFSGRITEFDADGPVTVLVNGEEVEDPVGQPKAELPHTVTVIGQIPEAREPAIVDYLFEVGGQVEKGPRADNEEEITDDNVVRGRIHEDGVDNFRFSGDVTFNTEEIEKPLRVVLDLNRDTERQDP